MFAAVTLSVATDPIPMDYATLPDVVALVAGDFSNRDIGVRREKFERIHQITNDPIEEARSRESTEDPRFADILANGRKQWIKRNHAVEDTYEALCHGTLTAIVLGSDGRFFRLEAVDWRGAAFWQQIIRGGFIRSSAGESIGRHEGKRVLILEAELSDWRAARKLSKPAPAAKACADWLEQKMHASPEHKPQSKPAYCRQAIDNFGVSGRQFDAIWESAIAKTGARWDRPGRPKSEGYILR
jgi:hypothetical protein